jgi:hypothetical protein
MGQDEIIAKVELREGIGRRVGRIWRREEPPDRGRGRRRRLEEELFTIIISPVSTD